MDPINRDCKINSNSDYIKKKGKRKRKIQNKNNKWYYFINLKIFNKKENIIKGSKFPTERLE